MQSRLEEIKQKFPVVALLYGGTSAEREVSLWSGQAVDKALRSAGFDVIAIDIDDAPISQIQEHDFDKAFIILHGRDGEDGVIQGALEALKIPYTGSGILGSSVAMNKRVSKIIWQALSINTAPFICLKPGDTLPETFYPCIVKPVHEGSSIGLTKVTKPEDLASAIQTAAQYDRDIIAEKWIDGDEYTVSLLNGTVLPSIRIQPQALYDFNAKYLSEETQFFCPSGLSEEDEHAIGVLSQQAFEALGCSGWGRVDFIRDEAGVFWVLEANTVPGMTDHSLVPLAAKTAGLSFEDLVVEILAT